VATTDALFAGKVQRKVSNGIAGLAAAGSSRHRQKISAIPASASSSSVAGAHYMIGSERLKLGLRFLLWCGSWDSKTHWLLSLLGRQKRGRQVLEISATCAVTI
jgi:hypothetical protein